MRIELMLPKHLESQSLTPEAKSLLDAMHVHGPLVKIEGDYCFARERFIVDPDDESQVLDIVTRKTYRSQRLVDAIRPDRGDSPESLGGIGSVDDL